jgi:sporulation protein YqfC
VARRNLRHRVASLFELPDDVVLDRSRITLVGASELMVENHRGLTEYTAARVVLKVPEGYLAIQGGELAIGAISPDMLTISGHIRSVTYGDEKGGQGE